MTLTSSVRERVSPLTYFERWAWVTALLFYVVGDMWTTALGIHLGAVESNPGGLWLMETFGLLGGMIVGKTVVLAVGGVGFSFLASRYRVAIPSALAIVGAFVTAWNVYVISVLTT